MPNERKSRLPPVHTHRAAGSSFAAGHVVRSSRSDVLRGLCGGLHQHQGPIELQEVTWKTSPSTVPHTHTFNMHISPTAVDVNSECSRHKGRLHHIKPFLVPSLPCPSTHRPKRTRRKNSHDANAIARTKNISASSDDHLCFEPMVNRVCITNATMKITRLTHQKCSLDATNHRERIPDESTHPSP